MPSGSGRRVEANELPEWRALNYTITYPCWSIVPEEANLGRPRHSAEVPSATQVLRHLDDVPPPSHAIHYNANRTFTTQVDNENFGQDEKDFRYWIKIAMQIRSDIKIEVATYTELNVSGISIALRLELRSTRESRTFHISQARWNEIERETISNQRRLADEGKVNTTRIIFVLMRIKDYTHLPIEDTAVPTLRQLRLESRKRTAHFANPEHKDAARKYYEQHLEAVMERAAQS